MLYRVVLSFILLCILGYGIRLLAGFRHNMRQHKTIGQNLTSGQEVVKIPPADLPRRGVAKTHSDFWKVRLERRCYTHRGKLVEVNEWSIRIQHLGRRKGFALGTNNKDAAAIKARDIYLNIVAKGWDAAEAQYNPEMVVRRDDPTVGDFLAAVDAKSGLKARTFRNYASYFRRLVADIHEFGEDPAKFSYRDGQRAAWLEKVHAVKLTRITANRLNDWRVQYIKKRDVNPQARQRAVRSANSYLRCARALFSRKWIDRLNLRLPDPLPFQGVKVEKNRAPKYTSNLDPKQLFNDAKAELAETNSGVYLAFLLGLGVGLRKGEIDGLEWTHVHLDKGVIEVATTEHHGLKSAESAAGVEIDPALAKEIGRFKPKVSVGFVIESNSPARPNANLRYYRAEPTFQKLYDWLRSKGVKSDKPLHTLRKEFGSMINQHFGLYAAMTALRHADIGTTSSHYTSNRQRIALPMTELMQDKGQKA